MTIFGLSAAVATVLGVATVRSDASQQISGGMGVTAGLVTYNLFKNPEWFKYGRMPVWFWLAALGLYGTYQGDKAAVGGMAGGYLAVLAAL